MRCESEGAWVSRMDQFRKKFLVLFGGAKNFLHQYMKNKDLTIRKVSRVQIGTALAFAQAERPVSLIVCSLPYDFIFALVCQKR